MRYAKVYDFVEKFAKERSEGDGLTMLHLLYGYAKLASFDDKMLSSFFDGDQEAIKEVGELRKFFTGANLDAKLIKDGVPVLLLNNSAKEHEQQRYKDFIAKYNGDDDKVEHVLIDLLQADLPEQTLFTTGHKLQDVFSYVDKTRVSDPKTDKKPGAVHGGPRREEPEQKGAAKPDDHITKAGEGASAGQGTDATAPKEKTSEDEYTRDDFKILIKKSKTLYTDLLTRVKGQDDAVRLFVQGYFQAEILRGADKEQKKPAATFLFAGPPGVGKTLLASNTADLLGLPYKRFDMSEFINSSSIDTLIGTEKTYKDSQPGKLTSFVKDNPHCIILFDEIEKAHLRIIYLFLQMLDGGVLNDPYLNEKVSFRDAIIIFTTNVGKKLYEGMHGTNLSATPANVVLEALQTEKDPNTGEPLFPGAICSRLASGNIIMFNHLGIHTLTDIVQMEFDKSVKLLTNRYEFEIELDPLLAPLFLFNQSGDVDARIATGRSGLLIKNELYELGRLVKDPEKTFKNLKTIRFVVEVPDDDPDLRALFINEEQVEVLVVGDREVKCDEELDAKCKLTYVKTAAEMMEAISHNDFAFAILDVLYGKKESEQKSLSQDDTDSIGMDCFAEIHEKASDVPVYLMENSEMDIEDKSTFLRMGARGFVHMTDEGQVDGDAVEELAEAIHLQSRADDLVRRGRVVTYNTAQYISDDDSMAIIRFYDFKFKQAVTGEAAKLMMNDANKPTDTFADVIGAEDAKDELRFFVDYMRDPRKFIIEGNKPPKGILLYGPPGTGKTMLARAMAGECGVSFFPTTANNFFSKWVGETEENIRNLFAMAKRYAPSVIFIDEIDAIGKERTGDSSTAATEKALNQLLTEMDGFVVDPKHPVFVISATNFDVDGSSSDKARSIDPALMRRFDRTIKVDLPKEEERKQYIELILKKKHLTDAISEGCIKNLSQRTTGMSLAILQNILELGFRNAEKKHCTMNDEILLAAFEEYQYGEKREWDEKYFESVAYHESGHAYLDWLSGDKPSFVTIVSRGDFGGYMMPGNGEKTPNYTEEQLRGKIRTSLAGRASEIVFYGAESGVNTGASSDLEHATHYAMNMICRYGMGGFGLMSLSPEVMLKSSKADEFIASVNALLEEELQITIRMVEEGKPYIEKLAKALLKENQLVGDKIEALFEETKRELGQ